MQASQQQYKDTELSARITPIERRIIEESQAGLPLTRTPYQDIADKLGLHTHTVLDCISSMQARGIIRRIGIIPNHYKLGYIANGMSVWNVDDDKVSELGELIGQLDFVSHCYKRPRHLPHWPYNLFAMIHARSRDEVIEYVQQISQRLGIHNHGNDILFSTRILKKTGLRISSR